MITPASREDSIHWKAHARVAKWSPATVRELEAHLGRPLRTEDFYDWEPDEIVDVPGNLAVTTGLNNITKLMIGASATALTAAQLILGVGSTSTAPTVSDTKLGGDGNTTSAYYQGPDATYPTQSNGVVTAYSTFTGSNANFAWNEWCWAVATGTITPGGTLSAVGTSPILINHKAASGLLGTKVSGAVWQLQSTITLS